MRVHDWPVASVSASSRTARAERAFPSSQVCSACGFRDGPMPLHVRRWTCGGCGAVPDRDQYAARNVLFEGRRIVAAGRAETPDASWSPGKTRAKVPAQRGEAGRPRKGQPTQAGSPGHEAREHVKGKARSPGASRAVGPRPLAPVPAPAAAVPNARAGSAS
ncbi:zinc ribbon domain-containing protein [Streptomyces venetus]|uniref:zinc ribbon domain-containing protein n=1 Tax=Streptomyces venetus TaxID=1701086 RepID=UPI003CD05968